MDGVLNGLCDDAGPAVLDCIRTKPVCWLWTVQRDRAEWISLHALLTRSAVRHLIMITGHYTTVRIVLRRVYVGEKTTDKSIPAGRKQRRPSLHS